MFNVVSGLSGRRRWSSAGSRSSSLAEYRKGEYYRHGLSINNVSGPVWQAVTNQAIFGGTTNTEIGNLLLAKATQSFWFDADGNQASDGIWTNSWDGENRSVVTENPTTVPEAGRAKETWLHDSRGRWVRRVVYTWSGGAYVPASTNQFVWDRRVLLGILDHANNLLVSFKRGVDFGGSLQRAGGSGGLLAVTSRTNGTHFVVFDGNGNVMGLVAGNNGTGSGKYEYEPFGKLTRVTGTAAKANPIRFSTQWHDEACETVKYLYRDHVPSVGRWLARDPLEYTRSPGPYLSFRNNSMYFTDFLGLLDATWLPPTSTDDSRDRPRTAWLPEPLNFFCDPEGLFFRLRFEFVMSTHTFYPPPNSDYWTSDHNFKDPVLDFDWDQSTDYDSRRDAVEKHEQMHIDDGRAAFDNATDALRGCEGLICSQMLCQAIGQACKNAVLQEIAEREEASRVNRD